MIKLLIGLFALFVAFMAGAFYFGEFTAAFALSYIALVCIGTAFALSLLKYNRN